MNDFTKEELEQLVSWWRVYNDLGKRWVTEKQILLVNKIEYMIDDYCEHKETYTDYDYAPERCFACKDIVE